MTVEVDVTLQRVTDRAILVEVIGSTSDAVWLPKSQIEYSNPRYEDCDRNCELRLRLTDWIARQKNITSNTTSDDSPINEDKWEVEEIVDGFIQYTHFVRSGDIFICSCIDERTAKMIAAAMALTEGKIE